MDNFKKYLPSKKFVSVVLFITILIVLFFVVKSGINLLKNRKTDTNGNLISMTVETVIQKDTNANGIADWEEYLWGLNPKITGPENKEYILAQKRTLEKNGFISSQDDSSKITQNELLSRQFFATIISLQQSGNLDQGAIDSISTTIGQEVKSENLPDIYSIEMLNIKKDSDQADIDYLNNFASLLDKYADRDIGGEMTIFAQGIVNNDFQALYASKTIADAYIEFSNDLVKIPVPSSLSQKHLMLANDYAKVGESINGFIQVKSDPIIGMKSLLNYKKYTDSIETDLNKISDALQ